MFWRHARRRSWCCTRCKAANVEYLTIRETCIYDKMAAFKITAIWLVKGSVINYLKNQNDGLLCKFKRVYNSLFLTLVMICQIKYGTKHGTGQTCGNRLMPDTELDLHRERNSQCKISVATNHTTQWRQIKRKYSNHFNSRLKFRCRQFWTAARLMVIAPWGRVHG
jgi:hypothetical protein